MKVKVEICSQRLSSIWVVGKCAYIPTEWISIQEAVQSIVSSGGQAVIAHPHKYGLTRSKLHELIKEFKEAGGVGDGGGFRGDDR